jgi:hypothetical protein
VQNLTTRMGLQMPPLPFLRLAPKPLTKKPAVRRSSPEQGDPVAEQTPGRS